MNQERYGLPPQVFTATPDSRESESRIAVDVGNTGFFEGRTFRISYEFSTDNGNQIGNGTSRWLRFTASVDFILQLQRISVDNGVLRFRVFRAGVESGVWSSVDTFATNVVKTDYASQVTIDDGGSVDTTGEIATETIRVRTSGATAQANTISAAAADERFLPAGTYYLQLENIDTGAVEGVFDLQWEERPDDLNDWLVQL